MNTAHFNVKEFQCKCGNCKSVTPPMELLSALELVRLRFRSPVIITSGYRCPEHNERIGGAKKSRHVVGDAADFSVVGVPPKQVEQFLLDTYPNSYGIAAGKGFTHLDVRPVKVRWSY